MTRASLSLLGITLNELNSPIKRQRLSEQMKIHDPTTCYLQETHLGPDKNRLKVKEQRKIFHATGIQREQE